MALRPVRMAKVGFLGLKEDEERILTVLHDLRVAQIEPLSPEAMAELGPERGPEMLRQVGDETLRFRGLLSALPPGHARRTPTLRLGRGDPHRREDGPDRLRGRRAQTR